MRRTVRHGREPRRVLCTPEQHERGDEGGGRVRPVARGGAGVERHHHRNPGLTAPGIPDPGDLIAGLGRLAFTDPQWTPARIRHSPPRDPAKLAPGPAQFTAVVSAVHHALSAVVSIAATDRRAVDVAVRASRLHVPTRTLPDGYDVPRKFANAVPSTAAALLY